MCTSSYNVECKEMSKLTLTMKGTICMVVCLFLSTTAFSVLGVSRSDLQYVSVNTVPYEYFTYSEMADLFHDLQENHSDIMSLTSIGRTYEDRDIWMVKLSDNVDEDEDELTPLHGVREDVWYEVNDSNVIFTIMEINYKDETYKIKSKNLAKPITLNLHWGEIDK